MVGAVEGHLRALGIPSCDEVELGIYLYDVGSINPAVKRPRDGEVNGAAPVGEGRGVTGVDGRVGAGHVSACGEPVGDGTAGRVSPEVDDLGVRHRGAPAPRSIRASNDIGLHGDELGRCIVGHRDRASIREGLRARRV